MVDADRSMIGKGVEDVYNKIQTNWLSRQRRVGEIDAEEIQLQSEEISNVGKKKKAKKGALEVKYDETEAQMWALLNQKFTCDLAVPIELIQLPEKESAIRDVILEFLHTFIYPQMWRKNVSYPIKPAIICVFGVSELSSDI